MHQLKFTILEHIQINPYHSPSFSFALVHHVTSHFSETLEEKCPWLPAAVQTMRSSQRIASTFALVTAGALGAALSCWLFQSVKEHGWEGTLRYIWEGEYYPEDVLSALEMLESAETQLDVHLSVIELIQTSLARAKLNSVDEQSRIKKSEWAAAHHPSNLEKDLATLSFDLDRLAATVDSVVLEEISLRPRKKKISRDIVTAMEKADALLNVYQHKEFVNQ